MPPNPQKIRPHSMMGLCLVCFLALLLASTPAPVRAHKVTVFAWVEGDTVFTQSKFAGGRMAQGALLEVYNPAGEKLLEGRSDAQGQFAFQAPQSEALRIVLTAGAGHRAEWQVRADEFKAAARVAPSAEADRIAPVLTEPGPRTQQPVGTVTLTTAELQVLIERAVERKLAPVLRRLEQQGDGPTLNEIIGGIGYILGLVGLGAYVHSRRKNG